MEILENDWLLSSSKIDDDLGCVKHQPDHLRLYVINNRNLHQYKTIDGKLKHLGYTSNQISSSTTLNQGEAFIDKATLLEWKQENQRLKVSDDLLRDTTSKIQNKLQAYEIELKILFNRLKVNENCNILKKQEIQRRIKHLEDLIVEHNDHSMPSSNLENNDDDHYEAQPIVIDFDHQKANSHHHYQHQNAENSTRLSSPTMDNHSAHDNNTRRFSKRSTKLFSATSRNTELSSMTVPTGSLPPFSCTTGTVVIADVDPNGYFVQLHNISSNQDVELGLFQIQQRTEGHIMASFQFPITFTLAAESKVTVWAADSQHPHRPPLDVLWIKEKRWPVSPNCMAILCKPNGQPICQYKNDVKRELNTGNGGNRSINYRKSASEIITLKDLKHFTEQINGRSRPQSSHQLSRSRIMSNDSDNYNYLKLKRNSDQMVQYWRRPVSVKQERTRGGSIQIHSSKAYNYIL
ncbi:Lamin tail domain-containing protein 1 [Trichoplax sp. H2]|nr:Lamin tail domain-containing protein 1 [Trichoplax sp. H2]|eukprot:RDD41781.1 Lamin tail domain-containing protein 1 [Trichoplax sp. H2]